MFRYLLLCLSLYFVASAQAQFASSLDSLRYLALIDSSFSLSGRGQLAEAEDCLSSAVRLAPKLPSTVYLLNNLAALQQMQGKIEAAILTYSSALQRMPDEQTIRLNRARLFALVGKHEAATTDYGLLIAQAPRNELYLYQRAMSYMLGQRYDLAEADLSRLIEFNPNSLKARLGYALLETARGRYDSAERLLDFLLSKLPKHPDVYEARARLYLARGMRGYAQRDMQRAFELSGTKVSATLYRLRAELSRSLGDTKSAQEDEDRAQKIELYQMPQTTN